MVREGVIAHFYFGIGSFDVVGFERRTANQASISNNPQTPDIDFVGVPIVGMVCIEVCLL